MLQVKSLVRGSFIVTIGTFVGGIISYLFSVVMGRMLGPVSFGDLGAISSFLLVLTSFGSAVLTIGMHFSAKLHVARDYVGLANFHKRLSIAVAVIAVVVTGLCSVISQPIAEFLNIHDIRAVLVSLVSIIFIFLTFVNKGIIQGVQAFRALSLATVAEIVVKILVAVFLVRLGYELGGAVVSIVVSAAAAYFLTLFQVRKITRTTSQQQLEAIVLDKEEIVRYALPTTVATFMLLLLMNIDIISAKRLFDAETAGQYIAVATIAKIIFFVTGPISLVMFPLVAELKTKGEKHYQTLMFSLLFTLGVGAALLVAYQVFGAKIILLMFGAEYAPLAHILPMAALFVILASLTNLMVNYYLSIRDLRFMILFAVILTAIIVWVNREPVSVAVMTEKLVTGASALFATVMFSYLVTKRRQLFALFSTLSARR